MTLVRLLLGLVLSCALLLAGDGQSEVTLTGAGRCPTVSELDGTPSRPCPDLKFPNNAVTDNGDGSVTIATGVGGGGDASTNTSFSVADEVVLFLDAGGKTLKRATGNGLAELTDGRLGVATPGTDYVLPSGNVATATGLSGNPGNCAVGLAAQGITAAGVGEDCFDVITPAELTAALGPYITAATAGTTYVPLSRTLTVQGTANQISVTPASAQDLTGDRLWTIAIPNNPTLPGTTTGAFSGPLSGVADTALALNANPNNCPIVGDAAAGITAAGVAEDCFEVITPTELTAALGSYVTTTTANATYVPLGRTLTEGFGMQAIGDLSINRIIAMEAPSADDQVYVSDSTSDGTWRALPDCTGGSHMTYTAATNTWGCSTTPCPTCTTNAAVLTTDLPVVGSNNGQGTKAGTKSSTGANTEFATSTGAKTMGKQLAFDVSGNVIASASELGGGSSGHTIQDEGVARPTQPTLNFTGGGVACTDSPGTSATVCDIPAGAAGTVDVSGTPSASQLAVFVDANTLEGTSTLSLQVTEFDVGDATHTRPHQTGTALPGTCAYVGETFFKTDAPAGQNLYACTALPGAWTLQGDGTGAAGSVTISGTPSTNQVAEWASGSEIRGVDATGTGNYLRATALTNQPLSNLAPASGASLLFGRGSLAAGGSWQEITLGPGLTMTGQQLSAAGVPPTRTVCGDPLSADVTCTKDDVGLGNVDNTSDTDKNTATATLTGKTLALGSNTISGTLAQFNTAVTDADLVSLVGIETLTNKTLTLGSNTITGTLAQFNTAVTDADLASLAGIETLTNKTVTLTSNTITGTLAQFNTAVSDADLASLAGSETLTNKTVNLANNTVTGTLAQFNSAVSDANLLPDPGANGLVNRTGATSTAAVTSSTVGATLRVTGPDTFVFGQLDLADADAIINDLPLSNLVPSAAASRLLGRGSTSAGDWEPLTLGPTLAMTGTELGVTAGTYALQGVPCPTCTTNAAALTTDVPVVGSNNAQGTKSGTKSGTGTEFATSTGAKTPDKQLQWDVNGNVVASAFGVAAAGGLPADPNDHRILGWDDTGNLARWFDLGTGLAYDQATNVLSATGGTAVAASPVGGVQFNTGGNLAADADFTYDTTKDLASGKFADKGGAVYNVKAAPYNALGNNSNDDTDEIRAAYAAAGVTGGILYFPPGTYLVTSQIILDQANVTLRGAGMYASVLKASGAFPFFGVPIVPTTGPSNPTFEDLGFDGNNVSTGAFADDTSRTGTLTFRRCRLSQMELGLSLYSSHFVVDGSVFEGIGNAAFNTAILVNGPLSHARITNNRFRYVYNGIIGNTDGVPEETTSNPITDVDVSGNFFDLGWYTLPVRQTRSGAGITYTATTLNDSTAPFVLASFTLNDIIRVMPTRVSGNATTLAWTKLVDTGANFLTAGGTGGVKVGEIVRAGGKFGIVSSVQSATTLNVEEWLDDTTRAVVSSPPTNSAYTVYRVILGKYVVTGSTTSSLVVTRWYELDGTTLLGSPPIPNGTLYEILPPQPNYPLHCEFGCQDWRITNNTTLRGYSDQLSYFGVHAIIANNYVAWGQDMGITIHGFGNTVSTNHIHKQGMGGIGTVKMKSSTITSNTITNTTWTNPTSSDGAIAGIMLDGIYGNVVSANAVSIEPPQSQPLSHYGISVQATPNADNLLIGNQTRGHITAGIRLSIVGGGPPERVRKAGHVSTSEPAETSYDTGTNASYVGIPSKMYLEAASCQGTTATLMWDTPGTNMPVAACVGTSVLKGVADFADAANLSMQRTFMLPADWIPRLEARLKWFSATASTNPVVWQVSTVCTTDAETDDPAFSTATTITDAGKGTTLQTNDTVPTAIAVPTCAAGELLHLKVQRDAAHASDNFAGTARLIGVELTIWRNY